MVDASTDLQMLVNLLMDHVIHKNIVCCEIDAVRGDIAANVGLVKVINSNLYLQLRLFADQFMIRNICTSFKNSNKLLKIIY